MYPVALKVGAESADVLAVNVTAPTVAELAAIFAPIVNVNAALLATAHALVLASANVTVKMVPLPLTAPVKPQLVNPDVPVIAISLPSDIIVLPAVNVISPPLAKAPALEVVAPNVNNVGVAPTKRLFATIVADVTTVSNVYPVALVVKTVIEEEI